MRKIAYVSLLVFIAACNKKQPECNSEQVKSLVMKTYKDDLNQYLGSQSEYLKGLTKNLIPIHTDSIVNSFFQNSVLQIKNVMTTKKDKELFSCNCEGDLSFSISEKFKSQLNQNVQLAGREEFNTMATAGQSDLNFDKNITYKARLTDDKHNIVVDAVLTNELREALGKFTVLYVCNEFAVLYNEKGSLSIPHTTKRPHTTKQETKNSKDYFTIGSTEDKVLQVMGDPTSYDDYGVMKIFHYGLSTVTFQEGKVKSYDNFAHNLKVKVRQ